MNHFDKPCRIIRRSMEVARYLVFADTLKRKNWSWTVLPECFDQMKLVFVWNRMTENEKVEVGFLALLYRVSKPKSRSNVISLLLQQHLARCQQNIVV